jgi:fatty-acyl-CoA synthase
MRYPDKAAIVFFGRVMSYRSSSTRPSGWRRGLQALGVQKGDRVVLNMQNCPQLVWRISPSCAPTRWWCR